MTGTRGKLNSGRRDSVGCAMGRDRSVCDRDVPAGESKLDSSDSDSDDPEGPVDGLEAARDIAITNYYKLEF